MNLSFGVRPMISVSESLRPVQGNSYRGWDGFSNVGYLEATLQGFGVIKLEITNDFDSSDVVVTKNQEVAVRGCLFVNSCTSR